MAFNGTGTFNLATGNPVTTGTTISSTWANNTLSDVASGLTNCVTRDGQSPATANLPMGNYKLTGLGQASTTGDALAWGQNATISVLTLTTALTVANGGTGAATLTGILKGNGTSAFSVATAGTDYLFPPSGTAILKANSGGALVNATAGTDYAPATSGSSILYGNGAGGFSNVTIGSNLTFAGGTLSATGGAGTSRGTLAAGGVSTTSTSAVTTGLSASITPSSSSAKILIMAEMASSQVSNNQPGITYYVYRGATLVATFRPDQNLSTTGSVLFYYTRPISFIDSPATTSSTTYTIYFSSTSGSTVSFNSPASTYGNPTSVITLVEVK